jgi:ATP-dependent Clp protease, protease subunit
MADACEIAIYQDVDSIDGFGPQMLRDALAVAGPVAEIHVRLNSQGGNVVDGLAIYNILRQHPARKIVHVDGMALSIASLVMCAGDEIEVAENSWVMIHNPHNTAAGTPDDLREMADLLDKMRGQIASVYQKRSGKPVDEVLALMDAETWWTGSEAVAAGFADRTSTPLAVAATFDARRFSKPPTQGVAAMASATFQDLKAAFPRASAEFVVNCMASNFSMDQARASYDEATAAALSEAIAEANKAKAELADFLKKKQDDEEAACKAKDEAEATAKAAAEAKAKAGGVKPLASSTAKSEGGPADAWRAAVADKIASGMPKAKAHSAVARENPELHAAYVAAVNAR